MKTYLSIYAHLLLTVGVNIKPGQILYIVAPIEVEEFTTLLADLAYQLDASYVHVQYTNFKLDQLRYCRSNPNFFKTVPSFLVQEKLATVNDRVAFLNLRPGLLPGSGAPQEILKATTQAFYPYKRAKRNNPSNSCSAMVPTLFWAQQVFPDLDPKIALDSLWNLLFSICRCTADDPIFAWKENTESLLLRRLKLNNYRFSSLQFLDKETKVSVQLADNHKWCGGTESLLDYHWMPNFPTEELFTANDKRGVNGIVSSSKPLFFNQTLIDGIQLQFQDGKVIHATATQGQEALLELLNQDESLRYCGEIALVDSSNPIAQSNLIFKSTLLDENAACHLALGCAYPISLHSPIDYNATAFDYAGINFSPFHIDLMFGTSTMTVLGITPDNQEILLMQNGVWVI